MLARTTQPFFRRRSRSRDSFTPSCGLDGTVFSYYDALAGCVLTLLAAAAFAFLGAVIFGNPAPSLLAAMLAASLICAFLFLGQWHRSGQAKHSVALDSRLFRSRS